MSTFTRFLPVFALTALPALAQPYTITTIAGTDRVLNGSNATGVPFRDPRYLVIDTGGSLYISDTGDSRIRKISPQGLISTVAGTGVPGYSGDRGKAVQAQISRPFGIAVDSSGNIFFADRDNVRVRRISPDGIINTVAGNGNKGFSGDNGSALSAQIDPLAVAVDANGNLYIADGFNFRIRKVDPKGIITTIGGSGLEGFSGDNGPALSAQIDVPIDIAADAAGNVYFADIANFRVRKIDTAGMMTTLAGAGFIGTISDGLPASTALLLPQGVTVDNNGVVFIADLNRSVVRRVEKNGQIFTVAGNGSTGYSGDGDASIRAQLNGPLGLAVDSSNQLYIADVGNLRIRKVNAAVISTIAGVGVRDGVPATSTFLNYPEGLAIDGNGNFLVADTGNLAARKFSATANITTFGQIRGKPLGVAADAAGNFYVTDDEPYVLKITSTGATSVVAGNGKVGFSGDGGSPTTAMLSHPTGVAVDAAGTVYISDFNNERVRKVVGGTISTIAGNGKIIASGDGGSAAAASLDPADIAIDSKNNIYVADQFNSRIRKIGADGTITTVAGTGIPGYSGDGGPATAAMLAFPSGVALDSAGNLYIADNGNAVVRRMTPTGLITTIAGNGTPTPANGDGGPATAAQLDPWHIALDSTGSIYVTDRLNDRIRRLTPKTVTPSSLVVLSGDSQSGIVGAPLSKPLVVKVADAAGTGVPGQLVSFSVSPAGAATLAPSPTITLNDGTATAAITLGTIAGPVNITASAGSATASIAETALPAVSPTAPHISAGGIASAGLSLPVVKGISPNAIVTIFGEKFAPDGTAKLLGPDDLVNGKVPTILAGVCAVFGTQRAPIFAVLPGQLNVQAPALAPGNTTVQVITKCDAPQAETSNAEPITVQATAPEFFYFVHNGDGHNPIAAINAVTGAYVGAPGLIPGASFTPARSGDILTLFATGFGATDPSFGPGELPNTAAQVTAPVSITLGGVRIAAADILYVGVSQNAGVYQVNIRVPQGVGDGDQPLVITVGAASSPSSGFLTTSSQ